MVGLLRRRHADLQVAPHRHSQVQGLELDVLERPLMLLLATDRLAAGHAALAKGWVGLNDRSNGAAAMPQDDLSALFGPAPR